MFDPSPIYDAPEATTTTTRFNGVRISSRIIPAAGAARGGDWCDAFAGYRRRAGAFDR